MTTRGWIRVVRDAALACALLVTAALPLSAQRMPGRPGPGQDREQLEERVRARFGQMVKERLGLDDQQAQALNRAVQSFQQDRMQLFRDEQALRKRVEALMLEGGDDPAEARELLDRMQELRAREARLSQAEQDKLLEVLTPMQVLRFQALREEMGRRIQRLRGGPPGGPPGMGPGGARRDNGGRGPSGTGAPDDGPLPLLLVPER